MNKKIKTTTILMCIFLMGLNIKAQEMRTFQYTQNGNVKLMIFLSEIDSITFVDYSIPNTSSGVEINGVVWAACNVNTPGTFASKPEDAGMFYQWNRNIGWSSSNPLENNTGGTQWNNSIPAGNTWTSENNVCPAGWRLPNLNEHESLLNSGSFWGTLNGVNGRFFGNDEKRIFLPAAGYRYNTSGTLDDDVGYIGFYWSNTEISSENAYHILFGMNSAYINSLSRAYGFSVRCVKE